MTAEIKTNNCLTAMKDDIMNVKKFIRIYIRINFNHYYIFTFEDDKTLKNSDFKLCLVEIW